MNMNMNDLVKWIETAAKIISVIAETLEETKSGENIDNKTEK